MDTSLVNGLIIGMALMFSLRNLKNDEKKEETKDKAIVNNISGNGFKQLGYMKCKKTQNILPLLGKNTLPPTIYHAPYNYGDNLWNYYTMTENNVLIPLMHKNSDCMADPGCEELTTGDEVFISAYESNYKVILYKT